MEEVDNAATLVARFASEPPHALLLDLGLPDRDGIDVIEEVRSTSDVPIIVITGRGDNDTVLRAFESGADDYVVKPCRGPEIVARLRAALRRYCATRRSRPAADQNGRERRTFVFEGWRLELDRKRLFDPSGAPCALTGAEFELLTLLIENRDRVVSRREIMERLKGRPWNAFQRAADMQILRLRHRLCVEGDMPPLIASVRGIGYRFVARVDVAE